MLLELEVTGRFATLARLGNAAAIHQGMLSVFIFYSLGSHSMRPLREDITRSQRYPTFVIRRSLGLIEMTVEQH